MKWLMADFGPRHLTNPKKRSPYNIGTRALNDIKLNLHTEYHLANRFALSEC